MAMPFTLGRDDGHGRVGWVVSAVAVSSNRLFAMGYPKLGRGRGARGAFTRVELDIGLMP